MVWYGISLYGMVPILPTFFWEIVVNIPYMDTVGLVD